MLKWMETTGRAEEDAIPALLTAAGEGFIAECGTETLGETEAIRLCCRDPDGQPGSGQEIRPFNTKILTPDNDTVTIPNSDVLGNELVNYSTMPMRRIGFDFSVAYGEDPETVKRVVLEGVKAIPNVVDTPAPSVVITDYQASAVGYSVRVWTPNEFYWTTHAAIRDTVLKVLNENGLEIPYDRLEVTMRPNASYGGDEK